MIGDTQYIVTMYEEGQDLNIYVQAHGKDYLSEEHALYIFT